MRRSSRGCGAILVALISLCSLGISGCELLFNALNAAYITAEGKGSATVAFITNLCFVDTKPDGSCFISCPFFMGTKEMGGGSFFSGDYNLSGLSPTEKDFLDPIVAQFPSNVTNFAGTFTGTNPVSNGALSIQSGLSCISTQPGQQLCAEPGNQLVIFSLPGNVTEGEIEASITFDVNPVAAIAIKAVITGQVTVGGATYYPVLLPCITAFDQIPSITIPVGAPASIPFSLNGVSACNSSINFGGTTSASAPIMAAPLLLVTALLAMIFGVRRVNARRASVRV